MSATLASPTRRVKVYPPARCHAVLLRRVVYPCTLCPNGFPGSVELNGELYALRCYTSPAANAEGFVVEGYRFEKFAGQDEPRDVACTPYGLSCDCPDATFRRRAGGEGCKHCRCVRQFQSEGKLI